MAEERTQKNKKIILKVRTGSYADILLRSYGSRLVRNGFFLILAINTFMLQTGILLNFLNCREWGAEMKKFIRHWRFLSIVIILALPIINPASAEAKCPAVEGMNIVGEWDSGDYGKMVLTVEKVDSACKEAEVLYGGVSAQTARTAKIDGGLLIVPCGNGTCTFEERDGGKWWDANYEGNFSGSNNGTFKPHVIVAESKYLSADEVKKAFIGNTLDSDRSNLFWGPDGVLKGQSKRGSTDTGKYWIKDDGEYCRQWQRWSGGTESCVRIKREGDDFSTVLANGIVRTTFKILKGNPEGL